MMRWERHWWQKTEPVKLLEPQVTVWVDPSLYVERPRVRASGTVPPPACVGAYCELATQAVVEAENVAAEELELVTVVEGVRKFED